MLIQTDWNGIAVAIGALGAFIVAVGNAFFSWRTKKAHDIDKQEAIEARAHQTETIIKSAVEPALQTPPPGIGEGE